MFKPKRKPSASSASAAGPESRGTARKGITRRRFAAGTAAVGGAIAVATALSGCGGSGGSGTGDPTIIDDDSQSINVLEEFAEAEAPEASATWELPLGTVLLPSSGAYVALIQQGTTAAVMNTLGALSLSSGSTVTLLEEPTSGASRSFFDASCSNDLFVWTEIDYDDRSWTLFAQPFAEGALTGSPQELEKGTSDYDPPRFAVYNESVIWLVMPNASGPKSSESSFCRMWSTGDGSAQDLWESHGRFATTPTVSEGVLTIAPRVREDEGQYYGITAIDLSDSGHAQLDQLVLPMSIRPFEAVYMGGKFAFSVEASYESGGLFGNMGTYVGTGSGPYYTLSREPFACVCGKEGRYAVKSQSSHFLIDTDQETYAVIYAPDHSLDFGDYPATIGTADTLVTFATVRNQETGMPEKVVARTFAL